MPYVMVPVPEEHVEGVMEFILRSMARAAIEPWDTSGISELYESVDEGTRSLLAFVARAAVDGVDLEANEAARNLQVTVRETTGIMNELNVMTREANRPTLITARQVTDRLPNGRIAERRVLQMDTEIAELVRAAVKEEMAGAGDPLGGASE